MDAHRAVAKGYLPKEVPPVFSSATFAHAAFALTQTRPTGESGSAKFSLARAGGLRRPAALPSPFAHLELVDLCAYNWKRLRSLTARSPISSSRPLRARHRDLRSLRFSGGNDRFDRLRRTQGARYTLHTDVSDFYPSIYTHAVDWAIRGKKAAKRDRSARSLGAKIDRALRNQSYGQTSGICIGPDTSWLIGEILMARIDQELCRRVARVAEHAHRWYDDLTFFATSLGEAESALGEYERVLAEYELSLNPSKTSITSGIRLHDNRWLISLRQARYRDDSQANLAGDIIDLFTMAFEIASSDSSTGAISYAIKRCNPFPAGAAWPTYQHLLLTSAALEPSCLPYVHDVLLFAESVGLPLDRDGIQREMNEICRKHAELDHGFEVTWALTILRQLDLPLDPASATKVTGMTDNFALLLLLDAWRASFALMAAVDVDPAIRRAEAPGAFETEDWLLAYEARARRWCRSAGWTRAPAWRELRDAKVRFLTLTVSKRRPKLRRLRPAFLPIWPYT
ncbi:MAG: RNA-directed DNA polymerase [Acidimicrobiia bacterium]